MKNECHIVRDLMPLYTEGMLSNESSGFRQDASGDPVRTAARHTAARKRPLSPKLTPRSSAPVRLACCGR